MSHWKTAGRGHAWACTRARVALNLGLGMLAIVEPGEVDAVTRALTAAGETVWTVGDVVAGERGVEWIPRMS